MTGAAVHALQNRTRLTGTLLLFSQSSPMNWIKKVVDFFSVGVWKVKKDDVSPLVFFLVKLLKILLLAAKAFTTRRITRAASALTYSTMLAMVPMVAVVFAIARGFGFNKNIEIWFRDVLSSQPQVADIIVGFVNSYLVHVKSGVILGFGLLVMLWTVMMLISNVETTFNDIWGVKNSKGLLRNLVDYTAFFFLLPIVVVVTSGISIFITTSSAQLGELVAPIVSIGIKVLPYVIMSAVFIAIYMLMPNTKVKFRSALMPGIIAGVAMQILQLFYIHSQIWVSSYNAIYGSFAALPLFMLWMQISWVICLFGAQLCYTNQNLDELAFLNSEVKVSHAYKMMASAWLLSIVCKQFGNEYCKPLTPRQLHLQTGIPMRVVSSLLNDLQTANLVDDVSGGGKDVEAAYKPAETLDNITMGAMVERLEAAGVSWNDDDWPLIKSEKWEEVMRLRNDYLLRLRDIPVKAL